MLQILHSKGARITHCNMPKFQVFLEMIRSPEWTSRSHRTNAVMLRTNDLAAFPPGFVIGHGHNVHTLQQNQVKFESQNEAMLSFVLLFTPSRLSYPCVVSRCRGKGWKEQYKDSTNFLC